MRAPELLKQIVALLTRALSGSPLVRRSGIDHALMPRGERAPEGVEITVAIRPHHDSPVITLRPAEGQPLRREGKPVKPSGGGAPPPA